MIEMYTNTSGKTYRHPNVQFKYTHNSWNAGYYSFVRLETTLDQLEDILWIPRIHDDYNDTLSIQADFFCKLSEAKPGQTQLAVL